jgi:hypothetical protein
MAKQRYVVVLCPVIGLKRLLLLLLQKMKPVKSVGQKQGENSEQAAAG